MIIAEIKSNDDIIPDMERGLEVVVVFVVVEYLTFHHFTNIVTRVAKPLM